MVWWEKPSQAPQVPGMPGGAEAGWGPVYQSSVRSHGPHRDREMGMSPCTWQPSLSTLPLLAGGYFLSGKADVG